MRDPSSSQFANVKLPKSNSSLFISILIHIIYDAHAHIGIKSNCARVPAWATGNNLKLISILHSRNENLFSG